MSTTDARVLLVFHSGEGQTAKIADRIAQRLRGAGAAVEVHDADDAPSPAGFDAVVLGDSIHVGHHSKALRRYGEEHADAVNAMPMALFQVCMASADHDDEHDHIANKYLADLLHETGIDPDVVGMFAGALAYTRYGWITKRVVRSIEKREGRSTDMTKDVEYTDWDAVDHFADDVVAMLAVSGRS